MYTDPTRNVHYSIHLTPLRVYTSVDPNMPIRKLRDLDGTASVSLPRYELRRDDHLNDGKIPDSLDAAVDRIGEGTYVVRLVDEDEDVPEIRESELVKREIDRALGESVRDGRLSPSAD